MTTIEGPATHTLDAESVVEIWIPGIPRPQGSKRHVGNGRMVEMSKGLPEWRHMIEWTTAKRMRDIGITKPLRTAVLDVAFIMPRPKSHYGSDGITIKERYLNITHTVRPDRDKLLRALCDGLVYGGILEDDSQIYDGRTLKRYTRPDETPGALVRIRP